MQDHRKLRVWKQAHELAVRIRSTTQEFPATGSECELAKDYAVLGLSAWQELSTAVIDVRRMLFGLRKKVLLSPHSKRLASAERTTVNG